MNRVFRNSASVIHSASLRGWTSMRTGIRQRMSAFRALERGQSTVEFALLAPLLLIIFMGVAEAGTLYDRQHTMVVLSREGANIASRGAELSEVVSLVLTNGADLDLDGRGGVIVSRVFVEDGTPEVVAQEASPGFLAHSKLGPIGGPATPLIGVGLVDGQNVHVVEIYSEYRAFTPLSVLVESAVPEGLYTRSVF